MPWHYYQLGKTNFQTRQFQGTSWHHRGITLPSLPAGRDFANLSLVDGLAFMQVGIEESHSKIFPSKIWLYIVWFGWSDSF